ncbi:MAG: HD-GYP domain-containing protein [Peptococcaceae bacterium]|nr:HD-GYP domain-containing protein [Peptococcaceae bacterium]
MYKFLQQQLNRVLAWLTPRYFRWLVLYAIIWLVLGVALAHLAEGQMINAIGRNSGNMVAAMLADNFTPQDFAGTFSPAMSRKLDSEFAVHRLNNNHIARIKIFDRNGKILYASDHSQVGGYETEDMPLIKSGQVGSVTDAGLYSVFVPIDLGGSAQRVGTFEFYVNTNGLTGFINNLRLIIGAFIVLSAIITLSALNLLIKRATVAIESKNKTLQRLSARLDESNNFLAQANSGTIAALLTALDAKDHYTAQHSANVAAYAMRIGQALQLSLQELRLLETAAILHDVGKIGISESILNKPGSLDTAEFGLIKRHPEIGAQIVQFCYFMEGVAEIILHHHERFDGEGYPHGLVGLAIPLGSRILSVADVYDAISTDRPYRPAMSQGKAKMVLEQGKGTQFDPEVVDAFLAVLSQDSVA